MSQRYTDAISLAYMAGGYCPECGRRPAAHDHGLRNCSLRVSGVIDRIEQYRADLRAASQPEQTYASVTETAHERPIVIVL